MYKNIKSYGKDFLNKAYYPPTEDERTCKLLIVGLLMGIGVTSLFKINLPLERSASVRNIVLTQIENFYKKLKNMDFSANYCQQISEQAEQTKANIRAIIEDYNDKTKDKYDYTAKEIEYFESLVDERAQIILNILETFQNYQEEKITINDLPIELTKKVMSVASQDDLNNDELQTIIFDWIDVALKNKKNLPPHQPSKQSNTENNFKSLPGKTENISEKTTQQVKSVSQQVTPKKDPGKDLYNQFLANVCDKFEISSVPINSKPVIGKKFLDNLENDDSKIIQDKLNLLVQEVRENSDINKYNDFPKFSNELEEKIDSEIVTVNQSLKKLKSKFKVSAKDVRQILVSNILIKQMYIDYENVMLALGSIYQSTFLGEKVGAADRAYFFEKAEAMFLILKSKYELFAERLHLLSIEGVIGKQKYNVKTLHQYWLDEREKWFPTNVL